MKQSSLRNLMLLGFNIDLTASVTWWTFANRKLFTQMWYWNLCEIVYRATLICTLGITRRGGRWKSTWTGRGRSFMEKLNNWPPLYRGAYPCTMWWMHFAVQVTAKLYMSLYLKQTKQSLPIAKIKFFDNVICSKCIPRMKCLWQ